MTIALATSTIARRGLPAVLVAVALLLLLLPSPARAGAAPSGRPPGTTSRAGSGSGGASALSAVPRDLPVLNPPSANSEGEALIADGVRPQIGARYPVLELDSLDGSLVNAGRIAGRPFVLEFFATWCQPCHRALADLLTIRAAPRSAALVIVLVSVGEQPEVVRRWLAAAGLPEDIIVTTDPAGHAAGRWGARRLPTTFVVDGTGVLRHINRGWGPGYRNRMARWLAKM